jgi:hypothetical protein
MTLPPPPHEECRMPDPALRRPGQRLARAVLAALLAPLAALWLAAAAAAQTAPAPAPTPAPATGSVTAPGTAPEPAQIAAADDLIDAMRVAELLAIMGEEGVAYGAELEDGMFPRAGGPSWAAAVAGIYDADRVLPIFRDALAAALPRDPAQAAAMSAFFRSDLGQRALVLELSARRALLDEAVEDASRLRLEELRAEKDPRFQLIAEFVGANDLIEANVTGGLNSNLAFYRGLSDAGALDPPMSEADMLDDVWSQEPALRAETEDWLFAFLILAYAPLDDADLKSYIAFSASREGRALNAALFAGFDSIFTDVSYRLGSAAAVFAAGEDL